MLLETESIEGLFGRQKRNVLWHLCPSVHLLLCSSYNLWPRSLVVISLMPMPQHHGLNTRVNSPHRKPWILITFCWLLIVYGDAQLIEEHSRRAVVNPGRRWRIAVISPGCEDRLRHISILYQQYKGDSYSNCKGILTPTCQ